MLNVHYAILSLLVCVLVWFVLLSVGMKTIIPCRSCKYSIKFDLFISRYRTIKRKLATSASESPIKPPVGGRPRTSSVDRLMSDLAPIHEDAPLHSPSGGSPARMTQSLPINAGRVWVFIVSTV